MAEVLNLNNLIVLIALAGAVFTDLKSRRVDNRFVLAILAIGILIQGFQLGFGAVGSVGASLLTAFAFGLPCYLLKIFGGGDFKLFIAISSLLDWKACLTIFIAAFVWGAILGLFRAVLAGGLKDIFANIYGLFLRVKPKEAQLHAIPYTVAILFAFLSHLSLLQMGVELI